MNLLKKIAATIVIAISAAFLATLALGVISIIVTLVVGISVIALLVEITGTGEMVERLIVDIVGAD